MSRRLLTLIAGFVLLAPPAAPAAAASPSHVVDPASRGGACSDARAPERVRVRRPWCTIGRALEAAPAGATIRLREGAHPRVTVAGVQRRRRVTVEPFRAERPVVDGIELQRSRGIRLRGLRLTSGVLLRESTDVRVVRNEIALTPAGRATDSGVILDQAERVVVRANHIHDGRDGVNVLGTSVPSRDVVIAGNHFQRMGNDGVHVSTGSDMLVVGNHFDDVQLRNDVDPAAHADGAQIMGPTRNITFWGNRVTGGRGFLFMVSPQRHGMTGQGHVDLLVANNVLLGWDFGIRSFSTPGARFVNNTVWGRSQSQFSGMDVRDRAGTANARTTGMVLANNVVKRLHVDPTVETAEWTANVVAGGARSATDLAAPPRFRDLAAGDVRLLPGSPGVDTALRRLAAPLDADGRARGPRPDAGAYEIGAGPSAGLTRVLRQLRALGR